jgi:signal transduction histidine kinase/ligand-binding sensor domain-containing protein
VNVLRKTLVALLCFVALLAPALAWAQSGTTPVPLHRSAPANQYVLAAWTTDQGLPAGDVRAMAQDRDGFLWLATATGLVRFDGFEFTPWGAHGEPPLPGTFVRSLIAARDGSLWAGFTDAPGVVRIAGTRVTRYAEQDGLPSGPISLLLQQQDGTLWAGGRGGLSSFRNSAWQRAETSSGLPAADLYSLYEDSRQTLWVGTAAGVLRLPRGEASFTLLDASLTFVQSFAEDGAGTVWAGDTQQIVRSLTSSLRPDHGDDVRMPTPGWQLRRSARGDVWIAALGGGLLHLRPRDGGRPVLERVPYENTLAGSPQSLYQDRDGNLWVAMRGGGLLRLSEAIVRTDLPLDGLTNDGVRALTAGMDGSVWVATGHNINVFAGGHHRTLPIPQTMALHTDARGQVWAATHEGLGRIIDGRFHEVRLPRPLRFELLTSITTDAEGAVWLCTGAEGVARFDGRTLTRFDDTPEVSGRPCTFAFGDSRGRVWFGFARGGVSVYEGGRFRAFSAADGLADGTVMAVYEDQRQAVWISLTSGLSRYDGRRFTSVTRQNGLPDSIVPSIIEDADGGFWVGVNSGAALIRFTREEVDRVAADPSHTIQYALYDVSDGLRGIIHWWSHPSAVRGENGALWFVTGAGVAVVDPRRLPTAQRPAQPRIERLLVDGRAQDPRGDLVLSPGTSTIQIEYSALGLSGASKFRFRYRLEGLGTDWVDAGSRRVASYTDLPPGRYRFRVAATTGGEWTDAAVPLAFTLRAPFYRTTVFYALCALGIALLVWAYWWSRMKAARREFALVLEERARMSREIHDTLLQDLGAIGLELNVLAEQADASQPAVRTALHDLRRQVARCLRSARQSVWELRSPRRDDRGLITGFEGLAEDARSKGATVDVVVQGTLRRCSQEVEEQLLRIGQEALNNAVRHGRANRIQITIDYRADEVAVRVTDDGVGFTAGPPATESGHWGLLNMHERAESIRARFAVSSRVGHGTTVEAVAPVTQS